MKTIRRHFFYSNNISNDTILRYIIDTHKYEYNEYISISKTLAKDAIDEINVNNNATTEAFQVISRFPKKKKKHSMECGFLNAYSETYVVFYDNVV